MKLTKKTKLTEAALAHRRAKMHRKYRTLLGRVDAMDAIVADHDAQGTELVWIVNPPPFEPSVYLATEELN